MPRINRDKIQIPEVMESWLTANNARWLNESDAPDGILVWYWVKMRLLVLHVRAKNGWEVYVPIDETNSIDNTIKSLDAHFKEPG